MAQELTFNSWASLVSANNSSIPDSESRTFKQTQDFNLNNEYPYGVSTLELKWSGGYYADARTIIIDGQGHKIINLRTRIDNPAPIFINGVNGRTQENRTLIFRNIDFVNCILAGSHFYGGGTDTKPVNLRFENCRFVGRRTGNAYLTNQDTKITCNSCYFDFPWYGSGSSVYDYISLIKRSESTTDIPLANYCRFHETYGGWTITNSKDTGQPNVPTTSCCMFAMNGCYIDGQVKLALSYWQNGPGYYTFAKCHVYRADIGSYYTASTPNVIDVDWISDFSGMNYSQNLTCYVLNMNAVFKKSMTTTNYRSIDWSRSSAGSQPDIILATPEEIKNATWLNNQGFPVVVPSSS